MGTAAGMNKAFHCHVCEPDSHTSAESMEEGGGFGTQQTGDLVQMVQHHQQGHEQLQFKGVSCFAQQ